MKRCVLDLMGEQTMQTVGENESCRQWLRMRACNEGFVERSTTPDSVSWFYRIDLTKGMLWNIGDLIVCII